MENVSIKNKLPLLISAFVLIIYPYFRPFLSDTADNIYLLFMALLNVVVICIFYKKYIFKNTIYLKLTSLYIIINLFSVIYSNNKINSVKFLCVSSAIIVISTVYYNIKDDWQGLILKLTLFIGFIYGIITIFSIIFPNIFLEIAKPVLNIVDTEMSNGAMFTEHYLIYYKYSAGITGQTGTNAFLLSLGCISSFSCLLTEKKKNFVVSSVFFSICVIGLMLTGKRGLLLGVGFAFFVLLILFVKKNKINKKIVIISLLILVAIGILSVFFIPQIQEMILKTLTDTTGSGRSEIYNAVWSKAKDSIVFGYGLNTCGIYLQQNGFDVSSAHNIYLQIIFEVGIVGFIIYMTLFLGMLSYSIKKYIFCELESNQRKYLIFSICFQIFFLVYGLTGNTLYYYDQFLVYTLSVASIGNIISKKEKEIK